MKLGYAQLIVTMPISIILWVYSYFRYLDWLAVWGNYSDLTLPLKATLAKNIYGIPVAIGVSIFCFGLVWAFFEATE